MNFSSKTFIGIIIIFFQFSYYSFCQIKVFERPIEKYITNSGLILESPKRTILNLNGVWQVSFDDGFQYSNLKVPLSYQFEGTVLFKKSFSINSELINNFNFILVCESINYEARIKINGNFIANHSGAYNSLYIPLEDNVLNKENLIEIIVSNKLNNSETIPLANQTNYNCNYGGINGDIYLVTVPKVYIFSSIVNYAFESENTVKVSNSCTFRSSNIENFATSKKEFTFYSSIVKKSNGEEIASSEKTKFQIDNFSKVSAENKFTIKNISPWLPENPELYLLKTIITNSDSIVDEYITELGFTNLKFNSDFYYDNGKPYMIKGINYHQESSVYGTALSYNEIERDLNYMKSIGFNCIRIPGSTASPYIINT
jgi:beta-galactosidase